MTDAPQAISDTEYDAIETAVLESPRGRLFLREHARRARAADTRSVIEAIERLFHTAVKNKESAQLELLYHEIQDMRAGLLQLRQMMVAMEAEGPCAGSRLEEHLDGITEKSERATNDILAASEQLRVASEKLRTSGADADCCDEIESHAAGIFMACAYVKLTAERTVQVIDGLNELEIYLGYMLSVWERDELLTLHMPRDENAAAQA
ncbi:MAG: hypothetical protein GC184_15035 [Rhizobiales bacterium]|nr:hypothetical protein [Hyphomicrobiales bacterium]